MAAPKGNELHASLLSRSRCSTKCSILAACLHECFSMNSVLKGQGYSWVHEVLDPGCTEGWGAVSNFCMSEFLLDNN